MTIGILDVGSNTMKLAIYEVDGTGFTQIFYDATYTYIIGHVQDNHLSQEGIDTIISTIQTYQPIAKQHGCTVLDCFSTASLRWIDNQAEVIEQVQKQTGVTIQPISGDEEAYYNSVSMAQVVQEDRFVGADLGGGSLQLFCAENGEVVEKESFPLGSLKMYKQFVANTFPTVSEMMAMRLYVIQLLEKSTFRQGCHTLYQMGGTARMITELLGAEESFDIGELETAITGMISNHALAEKTIQAINPDRRLTIIPGMIVVYAVADYLQARTIFYTQNSVREGYLTKNYVEKGE